MKTAPGPIGLGGRLTLPVDDRGSRVLDHRKLSIHARVSARSTRLE
jgi:hypothetical protein